MAEKIVNRARLMTGGAALIIILDRMCWAQRRSFTGRNRSGVSWRGIGCRFDGRLRRGGDIRSLVGRLDGGQRWRWRE